MAPPVKLWLPPTDPPGLPRAPRAPDVFDHRPERNRGKPRIPDEHSSLEWDNRFIATAMELGCPRVWAEQCRYDPYRRAELFLVWGLVQLAAQGDADARERVDYMRWAFEHGRHEEWISDSLAAPGNPLCP